MATPDGANVFFISGSQLTDDATLGGGLYRYNVDTGALDYLSTGSTDPGGAAVQGVVRVSDDGSRAYFVANDALGGNGTVGQPNLYLADDSGLTFIGTLSSSDNAVWQGSGEGTRLAKTTPDGSRLVFTSFADLTPDNDGGFSQVYLYDTNLNALECLSCPDGTPTHFQGQGGTLDELGNTLFLSSIPGDISDNGNVVLFQSNDALVPNDSNGQPDVYLWDNGVLRLLGTGSSSSARGHRRPVRRRQRRVLHDPREPRAGGPGRTASTTSMTLASAAASRTSSRSPRAPARATSASPTRPPRRSSTRPAAPRSTGLGT